VAINLLIKEKGGIENIHSSGELPRDRAQAANFRREVKEKDKSVKSSCHDPLLSVMDCCKEEQRDPKTVFIREVSSAPELLVVLANSMQLEEVKRFCTNPARFSVFGVDVTFNVGDYYVCLTTYRDLMLKTKSGVHPVMLGPILIHQRKLFSSYYTLPSTMIRHEPDLLGVLAFGTDGEIALYQALESAFPFATHLLCDMHMQDTMSSKLKDLGIRGLESKQYMADIFGDSSVNGLVASPTKEHFAKKLSDLKEQWIVRHKEGAKFYKYFMERKADEIANCMTAEVRSLSGLGYPPQVYSQNANECMNSVIKRAAQNKKMDIMDCITNLRQEVTNQQNMKKLAMISRGELTVSDEFRGFLVEEDSYFKMTKIQQERAFNKFKSAPLSPDTVVDANDKTDVSGHEELVFSNLSVQVSQVHTTIIPLQILNAIFKEANTILEDESRMHRFGDLKSYYVEDASRNGCAVHVTITTRSEVSCDPSCLRWSSYKICSHTIAVAEKEGILKRHIYNYCKRSKGANFTSLATQDMPKGRGKKATKATQRRKGAGRGRSMVCIMCTSLCG